MSEDNKQIIGDGSDDYVRAAQKAAEAGKQIGQSGVKAAAAKGAQAGAGSAVRAAEAGANAAAAAVKAGVEGGKAVAEIAAGTAAGGPWGAIIAAAWSMRHTLFKVLICVCLSLVFIITMVVSLPSILFNSIFKTDPVSIEASEPTDMHEQYEELAVLVSECITAGYDSALSQVETIISSNGYNYEYTMEALINYGFTSADYDTCYVLAAYSASMEQKGVKRSDMQSKLLSVVSIMFPVTWEEKSTVVTIPAVDEDSEPTQETITYAECTIHPFNQSAILTAFGIDPDETYGQFNVSYGDAIYNMSNALKMTLYGTIGNGSVPAITDSELTEFLTRLTCSPARKELMRVALSLVGRVPYFWGGKSAAGWNPDWNTPRLVTSAGSSSTGTIRPYGLDCSGFTDWVYKTALNKSLHEGGSWSQWDNSYAITEDELLPGDLGFLAEPGTVPINHVLLYAGTDESGTKMWVHCSSGSGVVLNSPSYVTCFRRVNGIDLEAMAVPYNGVAGGFTAEEIEWLTALVYYESRGMDSYCKELTAQVAVNRVKSSKFPNTLETVLKQSGQYGYGVEGATATLIFTRKYESLMGSSVWGLCYEAARKVAYGLSVDESGNRWPDDVLFQHSFEDKNANGTGHYKTYEVGIYWMHFNYG